VSHIPLSGHGAEALVDQPYGNRRNPPGEIARPGPGFCSSPTLLSRQRSGQADDDLDDRPLVHEGGDPVDVTSAGPVAAYRLERVGHRAVRIAARHPDPYRPQVDTQPRTNRHRVVDLGLGVPRDALADGVFHLTQRLVDLAGVGSATLGDVVLPAASATQRPGRDADQLAGL
jgi:hypothetical protein